MSKTDLGPELREAVIEAERSRDRHHVLRCRACGRKVYPHGYEIDHIIPEFLCTVAQRTDPANLQVLCKLKDEKGCHAKKTAAEARRYARLNRPRRDWPLIGLMGWSAWLAGGCGLIEGGIWPGVSTDRFLEANAGALSVGFLTFLVHNAFSTARPLKTDSPKPEPKIPPPPPIIDAQRVVSEARSVLGAKGDVKVLDVRREAGKRALTLSYAGTGFADRDGDRRFDLLNQMDAKMGGRWLAEWETTADRVHLVERPDLPARILHPGLDAFPNRPWNRLPVAPDVAFDLLVTPHLLIVGETGSGKTAMERAMIAAACESARRGDPVEVILADPKMVEFIGFQGWLGVSEIVSEPEELWELALRIEREMTRRTKAFKDKKTPIETWPRWLVFFDEYRTYFDLMTRLFNSGGKDGDGEPWKRSGQKSPAPIVAISILLAMARKVGIHLILSTQSPDASFLGGTGVRRNMPGRAVVGPTDRYLAEMVFGDTSIGRTVPSTAKGRATFQVGDGLPIESQTYFVPDPADADPNHKNTPEDWNTLLRLGMPKELVKI
jgi:hypothetical protein